MHVYAGRFHHLPLLLLAGFFFAFTPGVIGTSSPCPWSTSESSLSSRVGVGVKFRAAPPNDTFRVSVSDLVGVGGVRGGGGGGVVDDTERKGVEDEDEDESSGVGGVGVVGGCTFGG